MILEIIGLLQENFNKCDIKNQIYGRLKSPFSVLSKMKRKKLELVKLRDLIAIRVIVKTQDDCYKALDVMNSFRHFSLKLVKDYIANPKSNGYQSIHTVVEFLHSKRNAEIQIRSQEMHKVAELGRAAHLDYKREQNKCIETIFNSDDNTIFYGINEMIMKFTWLEEQIVAYEEEIVRIWHNKIDEVLKYEHDGEDMKRLNFVNHSNP